MNCPICGIALPPVPPSTHSGGYGGHEDEDTRKVREDNELHIKLCTGKDSKMTTIETVSQLKSKLEKDILELVTAFQHNPACEDFIVTSIDIGAIDITRMVSGKHRYVSGKVRVHLELQ
jgi:hypothetical protein